METSDVTADIQAELDNLLAGALDKSTILTVTPIAEATSTTSTVPVNVNIASTATTPVPVSLTLANPAMTTTASQGQVSNASSTMKSSVVVCSATTSPQKIVTVSQGTKPIAPTTPPRTIAGIKRPAPTGTGQYVTKVIITKNPTMVHRPVSNAVTVTNVSLTQVPSSMVQTLTQCSSPVKLVTVSQGSLTTKGIVLASPTKQNQLAPANKIAISPLKSPVKTTTKSITVTTPKKIAPAPIHVPGQITNQAASAVMNATLIGGSSGISTVTVTKPMSTTPQVATVTSGGKPIAVHAVNSKGAIPSSMQQIQVPGSKFTYVRLVSSAATNATNTITKPIAPVPKAIQPATVTVASSGQQQIAPVPVGGQVKVAAVPIAPAQQVIKPSTAVPIAVSTSQPGRLLMPANALPPLRPATQPGVAQLPAGTTVFATAGPGNVVQGYAVVPAQFVAQLQQQQQQKQQPPAATAVTAAAAASSYVPIATNNYQQSTVSRHPACINGSVQPEQPGARPRKPCNCTKSQCLKLYCDCFANGEFCNNCNCTNCSNNLDHETERGKAIKACLDRNPLAFHPKIGKGKDGEAERRHNKGCNCKRSGCLKNYCECYEAKIMCSSSCKCVGCKNFEESPDRKTLMHLADAAEVRVQQQTAARTKLSSQIQDLPAKPSAVANSGERLPFSFITSEVAEATCQCLLAQAEEAESSNLAQAEAEKMILEEFGRCLLQIVHSASRTKAQQQQSTS
ncbi:protein lin-54 homolog [Glandiceps talaboti]